MEGALHRFVRLLRLRGMRISTAEAVDAFAAATAVRVSDRAALEAAVVVERDAELGRSNSRARANDGQFARSGPRRIP